MVDDPIQVLVVSDYPVTRAGLRAILEGSAGIAVTGESANDGAPARAAVLRPDVLLLDLSATDADEPEMLARLISELPGLGVIALSTDPAETPAAEALQAGVRGYLLRDASPDEITAAVRAVAQGLTVIHSPVASTLLTAPRRAPQPSPDEPLTAREREVLHLMAEGLPSKTIANRLRISEHTVKFHVGSILGKLGAASRTEAVAIAIRRGLIAL